MRINITPFRPHEATLGRTNGNISTKLNKTYQAAAARMFYIWGEVSSFKKIFLEKCFL